MSLNKNNKIQVIKYAPPPADLSILGKADQKDVVFIGRTNYVAALEEKKYVFGINRTDLRRHMYIIGKSGVGKSKLQEVMIRQDISYGHGVCVIDSNGSLISDILDFIPKERVNDVCFINPEDINFSPSFNIFSGIDYEFRHQLIKGLIDVFEKQFGPNWNPRLEHILRFIISALLDYPKANINGMINILNNRDYRLDVISYIKDDVVKNFWQNEFDEWVLKFEADAVIPIKNRLSQFLSNHILFNIFNQTKNKIDFDEIINTNKILLVDLSPDKIGEENAALLGVMVLIKIKQAGMSRAKDKNKSDFYIYVDDFYNIATDTFSNLLSESKKYGMSLIFSHQYTSQISPKIEQAILGSVGTLVIFRLGGDDAIKLKSEFSPVFDIKDMINLGVGEFYIKTTIDGESYDPFSADSLKVFSLNHSSNREEIVNNSRNKYSININ